MRPGIWVSFLPLSLGSFQLGHHRIVTYGKQKYSFVPHSHAILCFLCFWTFVLSFESSCMPFFLNFLFRLLYPYCPFVWEMYWFLAHGWRRTLAILYLYGSALCFDTHCFLRRFLDSYLPFWLSNLGMGSFICNILFTLLPFHGSFAVTP